MEDFFRRLPKMTNNHIHLFALFPFKRLLKIIKKIDPELYHKIYVLKHDLTSGDQLIHKYTMITFNHNVEGVPFADVTTLEDWQPLSEIDTDPALWASLIIKQHIARPGYCGISSSRFQCETNCISGDKRHTMTNTC